VQLIFHLITYILIENNKYVHYSTEIIFIVGFIPFGKLICVSSQTLLLPIAGHNGESLHTVIQFCHLNVILAACEIQVTRSFILLGILEYFTVTIDHTHIFSQLFISSSFKIKQLANNSCVFCISGDMMLTCSCFSFLASKSGLSCPNVSLH